MYSSFTDLIFDGINIVGLLSYLYVRYFELSYFIQFNVSSILRIRLLWNTSDFEIRKSNFNLWKKNLLNECVLPLKVPVVESLLCSCTRESNIIIKFIMTFRKETVNRYYSHLCIYPKGSYYINGGSVLRPSMVD